MVYQDVVGAARVAAQTADYATTTKMFQQELDHTGPTSATTLAIAEVLLEFGVGIA
jgi:hypothetical protein